jgi:hypothetical protein
MGLLGWLRGADVRYCTRCRRALREGDEQWRAHGHRLCGECLGGLTAYLSGCPVLIKPPPKPSDAGRSSTPR